MKSRVHIGALGGTIAMVRDAHGGLRPAVDAAELMRAVPQLQEHFQVEAQTICNVGSPSIGFAHLRAALAWAHASDSADGLVLTHGTDTLEETAFALDLVWDHRKPLVITGAMRSGDEPGADGPANLLAAVRVAAQSPLAHLGVLAVINDEIHLAARITKTHTFAMNAFSSPFLGPIGRVTEEQVELDMYPATPTLPPLAFPERDAWIALVGAGVGDDGTTIAAVVEAGAAGVVIDGVGGGHVSAAAAAEISNAIAAGIPVVIASRTRAGRTGRCTYAYPGAEVDLMQRGAIMAGRLNAAKARILLWVLARRSHGEIAAQFAARG